MTQGLYEAVIGKNPSRFVSPERPVEQVSWHDARTFAVRLGERIREEAGNDGKHLGSDAGPLFKLPYEAEWEYACRAGTTTATYAGDLEILGARNAPLLDEVAWYGGNCGVEFDLQAGGYDISDWDERQYAEPDQGGTHSVGRKAPNPWGLCDMLGNVSEWCFDGNGSGRLRAPKAYSTELQREPLPVVTGAGRVIRGGSWVAAAAWYCRAAFRRAGPPSARWADLGLRLAEVSGAPEGRRAEHGGFPVRIGRRDARPSPSRRSLDRGRGWNWPRSAGTSGSVRLLPHPRTLEACPMKLAFFTIPSYDDGTEAERLDTFLSSRRVAAIERHFVADGERSHWAICVRVVGGGAEEDTRSSQKRERSKSVDYRAVLSPEDFAIYSKLRAARKAYARLRTFQSFILRPTSSWPRLPSGGSRLRRSLRRCPGSAMRGWVSTGTCSSRS